MDGVFYFFMRPLAARASATRFVNESLPHYFERFQGISEYDIGY